uniref:PX domain-containing protein n=1 Tax=Peronospora matthiolae TaxID=2874970 RepID=A0AAV1TN53_9STRA
MDDPIATEQLRYLNDSFIRGSLTRQEYDELLPFLTSPTSQTPPHESQARDTRTAAVTPSRPQRSVHFADSVPPLETSEASSQYQILAPVAAAFSGLELRCPVCGTSNDTTSTSRCYACESHLTMIDEQRARRSVDTVRGSWPTVTAVSPSSGTLSMSRDGRLVIYDGYFSCVILDTEVVATAQGGTCQVFVMCCTWQPRELDVSRGYPTRASWYVSQRFSHFEKLHKVLKRRFARLTTASMPPFPAKYHLMDRREKRKQGLAIYMPRLLEMCAGLPTAPRMPELDEFLDIARQVQFFRSQRPHIASRAASAPVREADSIRLPLQSPAPPMDEVELAQAEGAVRLLAEAVRNAQGDVRGDRTVQHHLDVCIRLAPSLQRSAKVDNPFTSADLIPRAMQCQEDLQQAVAMYNDALLAVSNAAPIQQPQAQPERYVQAQPIFGRSIVHASAA